jgi:hypothetical protein
MANIANHPLYRTWRGMKYRCRPGRLQSQHYGDIGIKVCDRWAESFHAFVEDMGPRPPGTSIDRINVYGNYEPSNCRWATQKVQCNNKRNNRFIEFAGERLHVRDWAARLGVERNTIYQRLARMPVEMALVLEKSKSGKPRSNGKFIEFNGERLHVTEWAKRLGVARNTIYGRLATMPVEHALSITKGAR